METHLASELTLLGMSCDLVGGLYLAYDLLGANKGPLNTLFRVVNYSVLMILAFIFVLGPKFAILAGIGLGTAFGLHLERLGRGLPENFLFLLGLGLCRAIGLGLAIYASGLPGLAIVVATLALVASVILPRFKISPANIYKADGKPQVNKKQLVLALVLCGLALLAGLVGSAFGGEQTLQFGLKMGFTFGFAVLVVSSLSPMVEWWADSLPPRTFGFFGCILFMLGFAIQAIPSLVVVFDIK